MTGDRSQIGGQRQMRPALHLGDDRPHFVFRQIDHGDPGPRGAEGARNFAADAPGPTGDEHALAFEAGSQAPCHHALATFGGLNPAGSST